MAKRESSGGFVHGRGHYAIQHDGLRTQRTSSERRTTRASNVSLISLESSAEYFHAYICNAKLAFDEYLKSYLRFLFC
ncbi:hypothetical protein F442_10379 [Phytophthora nicotianae P10297]|uniref:Uncharacterized protein n=2 Tax=Phytophthora nicotianae TaxID=4792 RepID=V9EZZ5_PHYNI|nr:hypothetical protein F443_10478 [Phytophthora nicotianae P1569]ETP42728.1 hypothetical protein F442_10379 [Phytophthora nicotianae P10297]